MGLSAIKTTYLKQILTGTFVFILCYGPIITKADEVSPAAQQASISPLLTGSFSQSKNIKPLKRPFTSLGSFVYFPTKGLLWHTIEPVNSLKLFAHGGVFSIDKQGNKQKEANLDNDFFLALFSADEEKLATFFTTKQLSDNARMPEQCLALTPKSDTLSSLFKQITLCSQQVNLDTSLVSKIPTKIELIEANGNNTTIHLQLSSDKVSPKELAYFD